MNVQNHRQHSTQGQADGFAPSEAGMNALLGIAGKQLGTDPQRLKAQLEGGQITEALKGLDPQKSAQINQILQNPQQLEKLLNSPQVKSLLNTLMKQK
ncbi:MAG: hypothetical protein HFG26_13320 [Provencibacterium sp.]|jgi:hypothetical protein|nr:hypothetical protein [Provencibacterium sp.]